jgi:hypothetical protein
MKTIGWIVLAGLLFWQCRHKEVQPEKVLAFSIYTADSTLTVRVSEENGELPAHFEVELYNRWGKKVWMGSSQNGRVSIDTKELPSGVYFLRIYRNGQRLIQQPVII